MPDTREAAAARIAEALALFLPPGQVTELRCLPAAGGDVVSGFFDGEHLADLAREAAWYSGKWAGVYFVPNPLRPDVLKRRPNRAATGRPRGGLAKDDDVLVRRWLFVDGDPVRAKGHDHDAATEWEREAARAVVEAARAELRAEGLPDPVLVDSGNGWHLYYPIPADFGDVPAVLKGLAAVCDTPQATIDVRVGNPSRVMKIPGTMSCKGKPTPDRPHRVARVVEVPGGWPHGQRVQRPPG